MPANNNTATTTVRRIRLNVRRQPQVFRFTMRCVGLVIIQDQSINGGRPFLQRLPTPPTPDPRTAMIFRPQIFRFSMRRYGYIAIRYRYFGGERTYVYRLDTPTNSSRDN
ncbi:hypothetical protein FQN49_003111 [Arthroderma sp. PD_2]|nr:hypothetical protein FQN49_003111 [Arthroderma sp. PD_2]